MIVKIPLERQILANGLLVHDDLHWSLQGGLHAESEVTECIYGVYKRRRHFRLGMNLLLKLKPTSNEAILPEGLLQVDIPSFYDGNQVVTEAIPESVTLSLKIASLKSMTIPKSVTAIEDLMFVTV